MDTLREGLLVCLCISGG